MTEKSPQYIRVNERYKKLMLEGVSQQEAMEILYQDMGHEPVIAWLVAIGSGLIRTD